MCYIEVVLGAWMNDSRGCRYVVSESKAFLAYA